MGTCRHNIQDIPKTLRIHLNRAHWMELLPGYPEVGCSYFKCRWLDIKKHFNSYHNLDIDTRRGLGGCAWGLTDLDRSGDKPTYPSVKAEDICVSLTPSRGVWVPEQAQFHRKEMRSTKPIILLGPVVQEGPVPPSGIHSHPVQCHAAPVIPAEAPLHPPRPLPTEPSSSLPGKSITPMLSSPLDSITPNQKHSRHHPPCCPCQLCLDACLAPQHPYGGAETVL